MAGTHDIDGVVVHPNGVVEIAISDHSFRRVYRGTIEVSVGRLRKLLAEAEEKWERDARYK